MQESSKERLVWNQICDFTHSGAHFAGVGVALDLRDGDAHCLGVSGGGESLERRAVQKVVHMVLRHELLERFLAQAAEGVQEGLQRCPAVIGGAGLALEVDASEGAESVLEGRLEWVALVGVFERRPEMVAVDFGREVALETLSDDADLPRECGFELGALLRRFKRPRSALMLQLQSQYWNG